MKILVTGAGGFLGRYIAEELLEKGHTVFNFSRNSYKELSEIGIETRLGDLNDENSIREALQGIEAVFHVASKVAMWGKWQDFYQTNTIGTMNLVKACKEAGITKFVYTSTPSVVFDIDNIIDGNETLPYANDSLSMYAKSKMLAEKFVLESNSKEFLTCALRPHLIFGPRDKNIIPRLVEAKRKGRLKKIGDGKNLVDVIYVENAAKAHVQAFENLSVDSLVPGEAYFIAQERPVNLWDFINEILVRNGEEKIKKSISLKKAFFLGAVIEFVLKNLRIWNVHPPMSKFVALQLGKSHYFSHKKALEHFNYNPEISIENALDKTIPNS